MAETISIQLPGAPPPFIPATRPMPPGAARLLAVVWAKRGRTALAAFAGAVTLAAAAGAAFVAVSSFEGSPSPQAATATAELPAAMPPKRPSPEPEPQMPERKPDAEGSRVSFPAADAEAVEETLGSLEKAVGTLEAALEASFVLQVPSGEGAESGFWRETSEGREHFVIVEARKPDGSPARWEVEDMDTGEASAVSRWAVRITEPEFARLAAEKAVSGRVSDLEAGRKVAGVPGLAWKLDVAGGALLDWEGNVR